MKHTEKNDMAANPRETAKQLLNEAAALLPLVDTTELGFLAQALDLLERIESLEGLPDALHTMASRSVKLARHMIMDETPFDGGMKKLGESVAKMLHAVDAATQDPKERQTPAGRTGNGGGERRDADRAARQRADAEENGDDEASADLRELLVRFAAQQKPVLEDFEAFVLEYEKGHPQAADGIRRILHTWKGEFGVLDLKEYAALIHDVEGALAGGMSAEHLLRLKDLLARQLETFAGGTAAPLPARCRSEVLGQAGARETTEPQPVPTSGDAAFEGDPSLLGDFVAESRDHIRQAEAMLLDLEADPANADCLNGIFRACHTIKGVSGFLGLKDVNGLSHSIESLMDLARRRELVLQPGHIDLLLEAMDCVKELVDAVEKSMAGEAYRAPGQLAAVMERLASPLDIAPAGRGGPSQPGALVGDILVARGAVPAQSVDAALEMQKCGDERRLGQILIEAGDATPRAVAGALASQNAAKQTHAVEETVRVPVERLDQLVDAIGEAVIAQSMLIADPAVVRIRDTSLEKKAAGAALIMRKVQELSMSLRMVSVRSTFQKMARLVRDLAKKSGKDVEFVSEGEDTELDKSVVENIGDPLMHMIRNSVDHGIEESGAARAAAGKPARARVSLRAFHRAGNIYIEVADDGRGLDREAILEKAVRQGLAAAGESLTDQEIYGFIFRPGFSTAKQVTDVSGRGVGMDVVRKNIQALRGSVEIHTEKGAGTTFSLRLPLTLAIIDGMIVRVNSETYIVPTLSIIESIKPQPGQVETLLGRGEIIKVREDHLRLVRAAGLLGHNGHAADATQGVAVIAEDMLGKRMAFLVDEILGQQQVVIKNIGDGMGEVAGVSGGAIMSDGSVSLILDIGGLIKMAEEKRDDGKTG